MVSAYKMTQDEYDRYCEATADFNLGCIGAAIIKFEIMLSNSMPSGALGLGLIEMGSSRSELSIQRFMDMFEISAAAGICQAKILHSINMIYYSKTLKTKDTFRYAFLSVSNIVNGVIGRKFLRKEFQHRLPNLKPMNEIPWNCGGQLQYFANITVRKDDLINRVNASTFTGSIDEFRASAGFFLRTLNIELLAVNSISPIHANMKESLSNFLNEFDVEGLLAGHTDKRVRFWHSPSELLATELI